RLHMVCGTTEYHDPQRLPHRTDRHHPQTARVLEPGTGSKLVPKKDKRIDAYIAKAQPFAKPILKHLRELIHKASPEITENIKWSMPSFEYKGNVCGMASFKEHVAFGFWKAAIMKDADKLVGDNKGMGHLGKVKKLSDLPSDKKIISYIKEAVK